MLFWLVLSAVTGCGGGGTEDVAKFDGLTVTVRLPHGQKMESGVRSADGVHTWKSGDLEYVVDHMKLSVNKRKYGTLKAGDQVLIEGGKVKVNDVERQPE
jgi:hypothetical protein